MLKMRPVGGTRTINNFSPVLNDLIEVSSNEDSESEIVVWFNLFC